MVAMETAHFRKMLNDAILASLGLLMWKVLGCIICKNPLWVLLCKVNCQITNLPSLTVAVEPGKRHALRAHMPEAATDWLNPLSVGTMSASAYIENLA